MADDGDRLAAVSGDVNPAHVDADYAEHTRFHGVIGHGMWAGALISSLLGTEFPGPGTIYLSQSLSFRRPVRIGDEVRTVCTIKEIDADTQLARDMKDRMISSLRAMVPSENNRKVVSELMSDAGYLEKLELLGSGGEVNE